MSDSTEESNSTTNQEVMAFFKSSNFTEVLKEVVSKAVQEAVEKATRPLHARISWLESKLEEVQAHANDNEQYSRKYNLRFIGIDEDEGEDCTEKIVNMCSDELNISVKKEEIDRAHRVGPKKSSSSRPIIVKFKSYNSKMEVCRKKKELKGSNIFINEDLTKANVKLFNHARKNCDRVKSVWASDGKILVRNLEGKIYRIRKMSDFQKFNLGGDITTSFPTLDNSTPSYPSLPSHYGSGYPMYQ